MTTASYVPVIAICQGWRRGASKQTEQINKKKTRTQVEVEWDDLFQFTGC